MREGKAILSLAVCWETFFIEDSVDVEVIRHGTLEVTCVRNVNNIFLCLFLETKAEEI